MNSLVSIIMLACNCEEFIEESINGICKQTYKKWELIIVKDHSEDRIYKIIEKVQDNRIRIVHLDMKKGLRHAFAEGLKYAKGEFVIRHDGDDVSMPTRLENQVNYLKEHKDIGIVSCLIKCITKDPSYRKDCNFIEKIQNSYVTTDEIEKALMGNFIPIIFSTLMIRRDLLNHVDLYGDKEKFDDHMELLLYLMKISSIEKINKILYYYRRHKKAYHIVKGKEYEEYVKALFENSDIVNYLQNKEFYKEMKEIKKGEIELNENSPLRILMLIDGLNIGGTETHVLNLVKTLIVQGVYVVVATSGGPMEYVFKSYGIKLINIPIENDYISNKNLFGLLKKVKEIIDIEKINLLHCHLFASMQIAREIFRRYKIPYIVTIHGLYYPNDILYATCIKASAIIAVSEPVKRLLQTKLQNRIEGRLEVIPNGIDMKVFRPNSRVSIQEILDMKDVLYSTDMKPQVMMVAREIIEKLVCLKLGENIEEKLEDILSGMDKKILEEKYKKSAVLTELNISENAHVILYCSRLDWNKAEAARTLIFSCFQLGFKYKDLHVIIVGDGKNKQIIKEEAEIMNRILKREVIHVMGAKVNMLPYYQESDIVVGTGRVALEAMSCGKPVVAVGNQGYVGLITEENKEEQWKMYFGDHDALEKADSLKLAETIDVLLSEPNNMRRLGTWGREWCKEMFHDDKIVKRIVQLYEEVLSSEKYSSKDN